MALINKVDSPAKLDAVFDRSYREPVILFKHSNACGISAHVLEMAMEIDGEINLIVIQENRDLSADVTRRTGHGHQSPQAFVLVAGKPVYHATHYAIDANALADAAASNMLVPQSAV